MLNECLFALLFLSLNYLNWTEVWKIKVVELFSFHFFFLVEYVIAICFLRLCWSAHCGAHLGVKPRCLGRFCVNPLNEPYKYWFQSNSPIHLDVGLTMLSGVIQGGLICHDFSWSIIAPWTWMTKCCPTGLNKQMCGRANGVHVIVDDGLDTWNWVNVMIKCARNGWRFKTQLIYCMVHVRFSPTWVGPDRNPFTRPDLVKF